MKTLSSRIYTGELLHERLAPVRHRFRYPVYFFAFDLEELQDLERQVPFFGYNRFGAVSLYDKDYLEPGPESIRSKLMRSLGRKGIKSEIAKIRLITCGRYFGYVFNPVSFFYCYDASGKTVCFAVQVNNTFDEMHLYILEASGKKQSDGERAAAAKDFHVSPFFSRSGEYDFRFSPAGDSIDIQVNLHQEGRPVLLSRLTGRAAPFTAARFFTTVLGYPLTAWLTLPRIHWQAAKLYFGKKLPVFSKPAPASPMTIRKARPRKLEKISFKIVERFLSKIRRGRLTLILPDETTCEYGGKESGGRAVLEVRHYRCFWRIMRDAGIGLGEGYMAGDWDSPDLSALLTLLVENKPYLDRKASRLAWVGERLNRWCHVGRRNTVRNSKKNIQAHYDLGNDFYRLFLDESMTYSSGIYERPDDLLFSAQQNKLSRVLEKARVTADCHVLEIGCGWGSFAIKAARETGCRVTGITLSEEQLAWARRWAGEEGLEERVRFELCDYRHIRGRFDRIVSIEMLEAVGHEYLPGFFKACDRLLKPDGLAVLQVITIPDQRYESYRRGRDWIQKHIFPGGHLPSLGVFCRSMTKASSLFVHDLENIGIHYARTLRQWRERFDQQIEKIKALGFGPLSIRAWRYYFSYCEAAFAARYLNNLQLVLTRAGNRTLDRETK